jgi:hypothetical protein
MRGGLFSGCVLAALSQLFFPVHVFCMVAKKFSHFWSIGQKMTTNEQEQFKIEKKKENVCNSYYTQFTDDSLALSANECDVKVSAEVYSNLSNIVVVISVVSLIDISKLEVC